MKAIASHGKAVKMLAKRTDVIMVSFEDAISRIPNAKKIVLTGTPVKTLDKSLSLSEKLALKEKYKLNPAKPTVLAFGGSQGAKVINDAIIDIVKNKLNKRYEVLLSSGKKQYDTMKEELKKNGFDIENLDGVRVFPYLYDLQEIMSASEILVSRSGAATIAEIANLGKPSILIPLPNVSHDHQKYNAEVLEKIGAAKIILNGDLKGESLHNTIEELLNKEDLENMGNMAKKIAISNVQEKIYGEIIKLVEGKSK